MNDGQRKRLISRCYVWGFCLCLGLILPALSPALEVGGTFRFGNLLLGPDQKATDTFDGTKAVFGGSGWIKHDFEFHDMRFEAQYAYDPILRNIITTRFINKWDLFSFGVGPFVGLLNYLDKWYLPKLGISSYFHVEWPGILFFEMRTDNSMFDQLKEDGDYAQDLSNLSLGFYVPHAICSFSILNKQYVQRLGGEDIRDAITEYQFATDIFKKNVPFKILINFSYLVQSKEFGASGIEQTLGSVVLGLRLDANITEFLNLIIDTQSSLYTFGYADLLGEDIQGWEGYLFKAEVGFSLDISKILSQSVNTTSNP